MFGHYLDREVTVSVESDPIETDSIKGKQNLRVQIQVLTLGSKISEQESPD